MRERVKRWSGQVMPWLRRVDRQPKLQTTPPTRVPAKRPLGWFHGVIRGVLGLLLLLLLAAGWLAWRLNEGPLSLPLLARQIERAVNAETSGTQLQIDEAAIAWEGFRNGASAPLDIRLRGVRAVELGGAVMVQLPDAAATLSLAALLTGRVVPATIILRQPAVQVFRRADGGVGFQMGGGLPEPTAPGPVGSEGLATDVAPALRVLAALMQPASERRSYTALRRIRLIGGDITVFDQGLGFSWALLDTSLDIRREAGGELVLDGGATLRLGELVVPVRLSGQAQGSPMQMTVGLVLPALSPRELAQAVPALAPLAILDAPLSLSASVDVDAAGVVQRVHGHLRAATGTLQLGPGESDTRANAAAAGSLTEVAPVGPGPNRHLAFVGMEVTASGNGRAVELHEARLRLPGGAGRSGPELAFNGHATLAEGFWQAALETRVAPLD